MSEPPTTQGPPEDPPPPDARVVPQPPPIPRQSIDYGTPSTNNPIDPYQRVADTVGFVPSLRWRDNLIQLVAGAAGGVIGFVVVPMKMQGPAILGAIVGFIGGVVISGIVLGVLRLIGAIKRRS